MKKTKKQFLDSLKAILNGDDALKKERTKMLIDNGFFALSEKDKESLFMEPKPKSTKRKKSNAEAEEKTI
jgi:hypothetical protein